MYANHTKKCSLCLHVFISTAQEHMKHCGLQYCLSCSKEVNQFYNRGAAFNPSHMKRKRKEKMKKNNTSCSFILTLKRNKIPEITSLIWCAQKTIHNLPSKVKIAYNNMISLYPCANPECEYPIGHPEFIDQPGTIDISKYYGLVKCKVLPPLRTISSCITIQIRLQTPVSTMQNMRAATDKTTAHKQQKKRKVPPFR